MQALILAAGRGSRLGGYNGGTPKCLLEIGRRRLIEHQLEALAEAGVAPVGIVVGYCADEVKEHVGIRAEYVHNPRWEATNSIYSFWLAREWVKGPVVIVNCDVLFHPEILARLLAVGSDAIAFDSSSGTAPEHMKIKAAEGRLLDMSKTLTAAEAAGENVGMLALSADTARALADKAGALISAGGDGAWLATAVREVARERELRAIDVAGLPWGEIDSAYDLEHVRKKVWPAIARTTGKARRRRRGWLAAAALAAALLAGAAAFIGASSADEPANSSWDTVELAGVPDVPVELPDRTQRWWLLQEHEQARAALTGPVPLRIESRLILASSVRRGVPYVLRVEIDGKLVDLYKKTAQPDREASNQQWRLGKRKRVELELPAGSHTLTVSVLGSDSGTRCLLRVREPELEPEPESEADEQVDLAKQ